MYFDRTRLDVLNLAAAIWSAYPGSLSGWGRSLEPDASNNFDGFFGVGDSATATGATLNFEAPITFERLPAFGNGASNTEIGTQSGGLPGKGGYGIWGTHACGYTNATDRSMAAIYSPRGTSQWYEAETGTALTAPFNRTRIGSSADSQTANFGMMGECMMLAGWANIALTTGEQRMLALDAHPLSIRLPNLVFFWPGTSAYPKSLVGNLANFTVASGSPRSCSRPWRNMHNVWKPSVAVCAMSVYSAAKRAIGVG